VTVLPPPYTTSTSLPVGDAEGYAFDAAGTAYISDYNNNAIVSASPPYTALNGNPLSGSATKLNGPMGLAFNANGELWIANSSGNTLGRFKQLGGNVAPSATISVGGAVTNLTKPTAAAVVKGGTTLVAIGQNFVRLVRRGDPGGARRRLDRSRVFELQDHARPGRDRVVRVSRTTVLRARVSIHGVASLV
jgi:hypothetical protein